MWWKSKVCSGECQPIWKVSPEEWAVEIPWTDIGSHGQPLCQKEEQVRRGRERTSGGYSDKGRGAGSCLSQACQGAYPPTNSLRERSFLEDSQSFLILLHSHLRCLQQACHQPAENTLYLPP